MDALAGPGGDAFDYVLSLQEATVVAMADGYAQASGRPAFVNLHTSAGLGNAIGNLTNAVANRAPLVVTAGNADRRHLVAEPLLSGDLVGLARGVSKWGHEVRSAARAGSRPAPGVPGCGRRPPAGPVFVAIPSDVLDEERRRTGAWPRAGRCRPARRSTPARWRPGCPSWPTTWSGRRLPVRGAGPSGLALIAGEEVGAGRRAHRRTGRPGRGAGLPGVRVAAALGHRVPHRASALGRRPARPGRPDPVHPGRRRRRPGPAGRIPRLPGLPLVARPAGPRRDVALYQLAPVRRGGGPDPPGAARPGRRHPPVARGAGRAGARAGRAEAVRRGHGRGPGGRGPARWQAEEAVPSTATRPCPWTRPRASTPCCGPCRPR